jgi:hypothetical protein
MKKIEKTVFGRFFDYLPKRKKRKYIQILILKNKSITYLNSFKMIPSKLISHQKKSNLGKYDKLIH